MLMCVYIYVYVNAYPGRAILIGFEPIFMYDPICFLTGGSPSLVENQGLPHPDQPRFIVNCLVPSRCFPETGDSSSISPRPGRILLVLVAEKIPLLLLLVPHPTPLYIPTTNIQNENPNRKNKIEVWDGVLYLEGPMVRSYRDRCLL